jgi:NADPH-dependent glutamate synthase beta subunit-like oxidoreductase
MGWVLNDLTPTLQSTLQRGAGAQRWQRPSWVSRLPPCNAACPAGEDIQAWLARARSGDFQDAWRGLIADNPLPATHGRVCYHPCESSCNRKDLDEAVSIRAVERWLGDLASEAGWRLEPGASTGRRVLIVGAGPAGLSCAWHLRLLGHGVEIVDAMSEPGGMLHYGIPAYRLPRAELMKEISRIEAMGVSFRMNTHLDDLPSAMKAGGFDAAFLAIGARMGQHLDIPALDGREMIDAITMFEQLEAGDPPRLGRVVGVVGGGNTAMDAARTAKRLGADEAILIYRRDRRHLRADPYEAKEAFIEGVRARWLERPVSFGREGVTLERIEAHDDGSLRPTGVLETLPMDALVLALGQQADVEFLRQLEGIELRPDDSVRVDDRLMTGRSGVFAGGDVLGRARTVTTATGHGKHAARAIDAWLRGGTPPVRQKKQPVRFDALHLPLYLDADRSPLPELPVEARNGFAEVALGIGPDEARYEAERCLSCGSCFECDNCYAACPEHAVMKLGPGRGYAVDLSRCTGCAVCFDQCPCDAIEMSREVAAGAGELRPAQFGMRS